MEHTVNPDTDRCVLCGANAFNRTQRPECVLPDAPNYVPCKKGHRYHQSILAAAACDTD